MLQYVRKKSSGKLASFFLILIAISMGLWGVNSFFHESLGSGIAKIGSSTISKEDFSNMLHRAQLSQDKQRWLKIQSNPNLRLLFRQRLLAEMIYNKGSKNGLNHYGYVIADDTVRQALIDMPLFHLNGEFNLDHYNAILPRIGMTETELISEMSLNLMTEQLRAVLQYSSFILPNESSYYNKISLERLNAEVVQLDPKNLVIKIKIKPQLIADFYQENKDLFKTKPSWSLNYIEIPFDKIKAGIKAQKQDLLDYYNNNINHYTILAKFKSEQLYLEKVNSEQQATPLKDALKLLQQISIPHNQSTKVYAMLKKGLWKVSLDKNANWRTLPHDGVLYDVITSIKPNQYSQLTKINDNVYFIMHLLKYSEAKVQPFETVKNKIKQDFLQLELTKVLAQKYDDLSEQVYINNHALDDIASTFDVKINQKEVLLHKKTSSKDLFANPIIVKYLSKADQSKTNENSNVIELDDRWVVLNLAKFHAEKVQPLAKVELLATRLLQEKLNKDHLLSLSESIKKDMDKGLSLSKIQHDYFVQTKIVHNIARFNNKDSLSASLAAKIFAVPLKQAVVGTNKDSIFIARAIKSYQLSKANNSGGIIKLKQQLANLEFGILRKGLLFNQKAEVLVKPETLTNIN